MATYYIDYNRGSDANAGTSKAAPKQNVSFISTLSGQHEIYLASDSTWTFGPPTGWASSNRISLSNLTGTAAAPSIISSYNPNGVIGNSKPTLRYQYRPASAEWVWDTTVLNGYPKGWYFPMTATFALTDQMVLIYTSRDNFIVVPSVWQGAGSNNINNFTNGITNDSLRYYAESNRMYLSYNGANSGQNPSQVFGANNIVFGAATCISSSASTASQYLVIDNLRCEYGGKLLYLNPNSGAATTTGCVIRNCDTYYTGGLLLFQNAALWSDVHIYNNNMIQTSGPAIHFLSPNTSALVENNNFQYGNISDARGGFVYVQSLTPRTNGNQGNGDIIIRKNSFDYAFNGTSTATYDGAAVYLENSSDGAVVANNIVTNSFMAFQTNSGRASTIVGNLVLNCDMFGVFTDANSNNTSNYLVANNTFVATKTANQFAHGLAWPRNNGECNATWGYYSGTGITSFKMINNAFIGNDSRKNTSVWGDTYGRSSGAQWVNGNAVATNNYVTGYSSVYLRDTSGNDLSSYAQVLTQGDTGFDANYRISSSSCLFRAGTNVAKIVYDFDGFPFNNKPSIGCFEAKDFPVNFYDNWSPV